MEVYADFCRTYRTAAPRRSLRLPVPKRGYYEGVKGRLPPINPHTTPSPRVATHAAVRVPYW